uniref:proline-rich protein 2-like n=1 Tax=Odobenus rosmarus divergens TaxID=9708 RepID=UPI00063C9324|nr:PREDICTED: proline-rich protein 2-like [Odobenus rosmarus divergens]
MRLDPAPLASQELSKEIRRDKRSHGIQGEARGARIRAQLSRGKPGSRPSPACPPRVEGAPRGRTRLGVSGPAPHLEPQAGPRPRPRRPTEPAAGSAHSAAGPRAAGRQSPSCSPPARRAGGGAAAIYIKGEPGGLAEPRAPDLVGPAPETGPAPPELSADGAGAQRGRPRGAGGGRSGANPRPRGARGRDRGRREYARGTADPPPASPARTWTQDDTPRPVSCRVREEIVPGTHGILGRLPGPTAEGSRPSPTPARSG